MDTPATPEHDRRTGTGRLGLLAILVLVPLAIGGAVLGLQRLRHARARSFDSDEWSVQQRWPKGQPRVQYREADKAGVDEQCFLDADGAELGCGTSHDGTPWDGTFVDWQPAVGGPDAAPVLKEVRSFRDGKPDGVWRSWQPDGTLALQTTYKNGEMLAREGVRNGSKVTLPSQPPPPPDVPVNRRPHPTYVP